MRKKNKNILQERFKIVNITKNPGNSNHDVTIDALLIPDHLRQIDTSTAEGRKMRQKFLTRDAKGLAKRVTMQGDYAKDSEGNITLRVKFYDKDIPKPYKRIESSPAQMMINLRRKNIPELSPYDEGGEFYDSLKPLPKKRKSKTSKTQKNEEKGRQLIGVLRSLMDAKIEAESKDLDKIAALCDSAITKIISKKR